MTFTYVPRLLGCASLIAVFNGCSLLLDDLNVTCKNSATDCHALNRANDLDDGYDGGCSIYQCRRDGRGCEKRERDYDDDGYPDERTCSEQLQGRDLDCDDSDDAGSPAGEEVCDGIDNNCNDWIDENQLNQATLTPLEMTKPLGEVIHASYSDPASELGVTLTVAEGDDTATSWRVARPTLEAPSGLSSDENCSDKGGCALKEVAASADDRFILALAVDGANCTDGRIRIGARRRGTSIPFGFRGSVADAVQNVLAAGVDRDDRIDCPESDEPRGARSPSLALLPATNGPLTALGLFRADSQTKPEKPAAMVAIGVRIRSDESIVTNQGPSTDDLVEATHDAYSEPLNAPGVLGRDTASVRAWEGARRGYFLGYDSERGVELAFVPQLGTLQSALAGMEQTLLIAEVGVRQVALAFDTDADSADTEPRGLAVAWRSGVAAGQDVVRFARVAFSPRTKGAFTLLGTILDVPASGSITAGPALAYTSRGFSARSETPGGWFVTWVESGHMGGQLWGVRIAEASGEAFEDPFILQERAAISHPFAYASPPPGAEPSIGYAFVSKPSPQQLNIGSLSCRASE